MWAGGFDMACVRRNCEQRGQLRPLGAAAAATQMTSPQSALYSPRRWRTPSAKAVSVMAWLFPSPMLVYQPVNRRWRANVAAAVVDMVRLSPWSWCAVVLVGGTCGRRADKPLVSPWRSTVCTMAW